MRLKLSVSRRGDRWHDQRRRDQRHAKDLHRHHERRGKHRRPVPAFRFGKRGQPACDPLACLLGGKSDDEVTLGVPPLLHRGTKRARVANVAREHRRVAARCRPIVRSPTSTRDMASSARGAQIALTSIA